MTLSLQQLKPGQCAKVIGFLPQDPAYKRQLMSLGLTPGTMIEMIRIAPMGDPIQIKVRNACLALRKQEATIILLERA